MGLLVPSVRLQSSSEYIRTSRKQFLAEFCTIFLEEQLTLAVKMLEMGVSCELGNEPSGSIKCCETTEWLHNLWPLSSSAQLHKVSQLGLLKGGK
jgi:hypothetical protein